MPDLSTIPCLTYPPRPRNGGRLDLAPADCVGDDWYLGDKLNGWRALVHVPSGTMFNRKGERLTIAAEFRLALERLRELNCPWNWLDCEALDRRHALGRGTLILLDGIEPTAGYLARHQSLRQELPGVPYLERPEQCTPESLFICPHVPRSGGLARWQELQDANARVGCVFYEGLVAKKADSRYPIQLASPDRTFPWWIKHRFD